jgi:signal transduction histidine kinase
MNHVLAPGELRREKSPAAWLVTVTLAVVVIFVGANAYAQSTAAGIDAEAIHIAANTAPAIARLARVWREIHVLDAETSPAMVIASGKPFDREAFERSKQALDQELAGDLPSPVREKEHELYGEVQARVKELLALDDGVASRVTAGDLVHALDLRVREHRPAVVRADAAVIDLVSYEAALAAETSEQIRALRSHASRISFALDAVAALLAVAMLILAGTAAEARARLARERRTRAEERAVELEQFADRVAHDLKGPLAALILRLTIAPRTLALDGHALLYFGKLNEACQRMNRIIDGLLQFARAGGRPDRDGCADVAEAVAGVIADVRGDAERAGAELTVEPFAPAQVACAPGALSSVLENLVRNAAKYIVEAPRDDRRIVVRVRERGSMLRIEVEDNGPGLPPGQERAVFDRYMRARNTSQPGIGLGLATVKRIVDAHGGSVGVESSLGSGACFWFELPRLVSVGPYPSGVVDDRRGAAA